MSENEWLIVIDLLNPTDCFNLAQTCSSFRDLVYSTKYKYLLNQIHPSLDENRKWIENIMNQTDPSFTTLKSDYVPRLFQYLTLLSFTIDESEKLFLKSFVEWAERCALSHQNPIFQHLIGIAIFFNWGNRSSIYSSEESIKIAHHWIKQSTEKDPNNIVALIDFISLESKMDQNLEKAFHQYESFLEKANNHPFAHASLMTIIGLCYEYGEGCDVDFKKAIQYYRRGSESGLSPNAKIISH